MRSSYSQQWLGLLVFALVFFTQCGPAEQANKTAEPAASANKQSPLEAYIQAPDDAFEYELKDSTKGDGYTAFVIRMVSQRWLTTAEVKDPTWWHWLTVVVPDELITN